VEGLASAQVVVIPVEVSALQVRLYTPWAHLWISWPLVNGSNLGRGIVCSPIRLGQIIRLLRIILEKIRNRAWELLHLLWFLVQVHFVILVANFVRQTTSPRLDLVQGVLFFVVPRFANIDIFVTRKAPRSALAVACDEHDETSIHNLIDLMITVLSCFDNLVLEEVTIKPVHGLFRAVEPAGVDPFVALCVLPSAVYLSNNRFGKVVRVLNVNPIT